MGKKFPDSMMGDNYEWLRTKIGECKEFQAMMHAAEVLGETETQNTPTPSCVDSYDHKKPLSEEDIPF